MKGRGCGPYILIVVVAVILYAPIFGNTFLNDDYGRILQVKSLQEETVPVAFSILFTKAFNSYYRPLTHIIFYLLYRSVELLPSYYYLSSVLFHVIAASVFYVLVRWITGEKDKPGVPWVSVLATFVFLSNPRHVESVSYIHDNENVICGLFFFAGLALYVKYCRVGHSAFLWFSCLAYLLSLLGKEMGITLPMVCMAYHFMFVSGRRLTTFFKDRRIRAAALSWVVTVAFYFVLRLSSLGTLVGGRGETSQLDFNIARIVRTFFQALIAMCLPNDLPGLDQVADFFRGNVNLFILLSLVCVTVFVWLIRKRTSNIFWFGVIWCAVSLIPILNNGIGVDGLTGGRYLYIPLAGLVLAVVDLLLKLPKKSLSVGICCFLLVIQSGFTYRNNARLSRLSQISENFFEGMGNIVRTSESNDIQYAIIVPNMYKGMYVLRSSFEQGLTLLYGEHGERFLRNNASLVLELLFQETEGIDLVANKKMDGFVQVIVKSGGAFLGNDYTFADKYGGRLELHNRKYINARGDFAASVAEVDGIDRLVSPDLSEGSPEGVVLFEFSYNVDRKASTSR